MSDAGSASNNDSIALTSRASDTTESERLPRRVVRRAPGLRLLFTAETIAPSAPWYPLPLGTHHIGRDLGSAAGLQLDGDRRASRVHALVKVSGSATPIEIVDMDSKNGVFVNGLRCRCAALRDGDVIRVGDSLLILRYEPTAVPDAVIPMMLGVSVAQRSLRARVHAAASENAAALLLGETGTGKDLTARALHAATGRRGPLLPVNCGAIPDSLSESLFFGHVGGSFTGAARDRTGYFIAADGGTLFLDEIGELSLRSQALLLRVLEDLQVTPIGATKAQPCDVRIVAATNRDLTRAIEKGEFRGDLYARLAAIRLQLAPLRARREDILILLLHALASPSVTLTARLAEALLLYPFPFNTRELFQLARELHASGESPLDLPLISERLATSPQSAKSLDADSSVPMEPAAPRPDPAVAVQTDAEDDAVSLPKQPLSREVLLRLMEEHRGIIARVAQAAGRSRRQVMRWLEQHQIDASRYKR